MSFLVNILYTSVLWPAMPSAQGPRKRGLPPELCKAGVAAVAATCTCRDEELLPQVLGSQALCASPGYSHLCKCVCLVTLLAVLMPQPFQHFHV